MSTQGSDSQNSTLGLVSWVMAVAMFFSVVVKIGTKIAVMRRIDYALDSIFALGAMVFAAGQTGALTIALQQGLGKHISTLSSSEIRRYQQSAYAAELFYISALCLAKISITVFFLQSTIGRSPRMLCGVVGVLIVFWWLTSTFALAFQCSLPNPWMFLQNTCFNRKAFWYYVGAVDAFTDLCIILLPFYTFSFLQLPPKSKPKILIPFCARIFVVPVTILRLVYLSSSLDSADPTFDAFSAVLTTIVQMHLSIIFACTPFSKFVMGGVQSGLLTSNLRILAPTYAGHQGYTLNSLARKSNKNSALVSASRISPWRGFTTTTTTQISRNSLTKEENRPRSPTDSEQHIIRQTTEWAVDYDQTSADNSRKR